MISGILNVNKPRGMASFPVVSLVRRLTGVRRVGHAGTLDPIADGVLPVCVGYATRVVEYLVSAPKTYRAAMRLGAATDTYDSEGRVVATGDASDVTRADVERELRAFVGEIDQLPPAYSALKFEGQPLYKYARAGKEAPREARRVRVYRMELLSFEPGVVEVEIEVGRGAYVRTLADDLGERLGCHAHLEALTRLRSGPFTVDEAVTIEELEAAAREGELEELFHAPDRVLESWYAAILARPHTAEVRQGGLLTLEDGRSALSDIAPETLCRAYSDEGEFLAVLRYRGGGRWHPEKVFAPQ